MSETVCYIDREGRISPCCHTLGGDCKDCPSVTMHNRYIQLYRQEKNNICGFSMGATELRECIKSRCKFWIDAEQHKLDVEIGVAFTDLVGDTELMKELKESAGGYCVFEVIC